MKLSTALKNIAAKRTDNSPKWSCGIACGFTPLHFQTFLHACMLEHTTESFAVEIGVFGDLTGNLRDFTERRLGKVAVVIEWSDLDSRLGFRTTGGWRQKVHEDISKTVAMRLEQLRQQIDSLLSDQATVVVTLPTLPLPPFTQHPNNQAGTPSLDLHRLVSQFATQLSTLTGNLKILAPQHLDRVAPAAGRYDMKSDLSAGFPYHKEFAGVFANEVARLLFSSSPMKGIITDLDNTLWRGILGEDGVDGVHWNLDHGSHSHGLYQEMLCSLAEAGTLVAVASKNERSLVDQAFQRTDFVVDVKQLFPVEAHWEAKSQSVRRILEAWNIGSDAVTFIDDSPMEIAEVAAAFPDMKCVQFPTGDDRAIFEMLYDLRSWYGKTTVTEEDRIRAASLRTNWQSTDSVGVSQDDFLAAAEAKLTFHFDAPDDRSLELINKTNQFNINGRRYDAAEWRQRADDPSCFIVSVSYEDKFGPLGKIAVAVGRRDETPAIETWVMSCRAFSRRIEHQLLQVLYERLACEEIGIDFRATDRNAPTAAFCTTSPVKKSADRLQYPKPHSKPIVHRHSENTTSNDRRRKQTVGLLYGSFS